jgi:adenylyl cyclase-associated protein
MSQQEFSNLINRLEKVTSRLEMVNPNNAAVNGATAATNGSSNESFDDLPPIVAFDQLYRESFVPFKSLSSLIGNDVQTIVDLIEKVFKLQRSFLLEAVRSVQPAKDILLKFFQQYSKSIEEVQNFREKHRTSPLFNHLSGLSESIGAFGWIAVEPAPSPFVKEMSDAAQFYTNRVLKDYKEKDVNHVNWVKMWVQLLTDLQSYVKQHHTTGVTWNSSRKSATFDASRIVSSSSSSGPAPPGPPPPPPMLNLADILADTSLTNGKSTKSGASASPSTDLLFAEINKGGAITSHLKKVDPTQQTHKNPALRAGGTVVVSQSAPSNATLSNKSSNVSQNSTNKTPCCELVDKKWKVEYHQGNQSLLIDQTDMKHTVYIYQCRESTITVKGKVNSILIDSCYRVGLIFDDVLSTVEFINSKSCQMQVLGRVPTVAIEKTDGCQVYLSRKSLDTEIVSSKSSAMNVLIPNENDDDFKEEPIPEQFKTVFNATSRKLCTTATETA